MEYSVSDYHHAPRPAVRNSSTRVSLQGQELGSRRRASQYSILDENNPFKGHINQRKPSAAGTEHSYDPFRTSRNQITKTQAAQAAHARTTVLRRLSRSHKHGQSNSSLNRSNTSRKSFRNPALTRIQQADAYSIASSPPPVPGASRTQLNPSINEMRISQFQTVHVQRVASTNLDELQARSQFRSHEEALHQCSSPPFQQTEGCLPFHAPAAVFARDH